MAEEREVVELKIKDVFNINVPKELTVKGFKRREEDEPFIPETDDDYVFRKELLSDVLCWYMMKGEAGSLFLSGATGSGKTSLVKQVAARLNIPMQSVNAHSRLEAPDLIGHYALVNNSMEFIDGPLTKAMRHGHWFLIDEIDLLEPSTAAGLNAAVEGNPLIIPEKGGEVVKAAPGFALAATGNTSGFGDASGRYQGTLQQNIAFMDRFCIIPVNYPDARQELKVITKKVPEVPEDSARMMIRLAKEVRKLFEGGEVEITLSTRTLVRWAQLAKFFRPLGRQGKDVFAHSLERALTFRADETSQEIIREVYQRIFGGTDEPIEEPETPEA